MAKALFITVIDLKRKSIIDGNLDADKVIQFIEVAQDTHIQNYLGTDLYNKLQTLITTGNDINNPANSHYKSLLTTYIKPMLIWFTQSNYLPFAMYQIGNGGVFKHRSENSDSVTQEEVAMLVNKVSETAEFYTRRFIDYMAYNSTLYPEYNSNSNEDMYPDKDVNFHSWVL
tara:strand:+ start:1569 stop:2084 length:516 start_codon:yes stop_codon:yes gene_type:complete